MTTFDVLVAGELNPDLVLCGDVTPAFGQAEKLVDSATLTVGSSSAIFACGAARLGLQVGFVGVCGQDLFGRFMLEQLEARGVNVVNVRPLPAGQTGLTVVLSTGADRALLTHTGLIDSLRAEDISEGLLSQARHLHVASYFLQRSLQPGLPALFGRARALGLSTSLDTNWDPQAAWGGLETVLPVTDIFLPNEAELLAITRQSDVEAGLRAVPAPTVAVKLGRRGALARRGAELARAGSLDVQAVESTGAGDSFDAGFVYGCLAGWNLERTLRLATACGSLSTRATGGTAAQPTLAEALAWL